MTPPRPIRLLTAVPLCDGHDSAINTINLELIRHGVEVVYLGYHRPARDIVRAAVQEDVRAVGLSSYNGGHVEFFAEVVRGLRRAGAGDIGVFGGGGGTITGADAAVMRRHGVGRIFFAGTPLAEMVEYVTRTFGKPAAAGANGPKAGGASPGADRRIARLLTRVEEQTAPARRGPARRKAPEPAAAGPRVVGITGPGGAGKTTLIDELALRFLRSSPAGRLAILSHDPSLVGEAGGAAPFGALLGDRAAMIYSQNDRVFMRSLATRGQAGGLSPATGRCLGALKALTPAEGGFDLILVETVGTGQEAMPFPRGLVDRSVLVMSPDYGSRLQLQKIAMLDLADVVVVNKSDLAGAKTAAAEVGQRLAGGRKSRALVTTTAKRHRDAGVDELFRLIADPREPRAATACPPLPGGRGSRC